MDKLVDEILTLSRVESGMSAGREESLDLALLVHDVIQDAAFEARARALAVTLDTDLRALEPATVKGNPEMLHRALENVVRNAVRHTPAGGRVSVSGSFEAAARTVEITIADDGPGVAPAELTSIFEPFFRGSGAKETRGHGLGLAIARRVIEAHGGRVAASNRSSGGLAVTIRLPA
jgi:signal transduction histidine kinase